MNYEWYQVEPFCKKRYDSPEHDYDIPAIIAEVEKRGETKVIEETDEDCCCKYTFCATCLPLVGQDNKWRVSLDDTFIFCPNCGKKILWEK